MNWKNTREQESENLNCLNTEVPGFGLVVLTKNTDYYIRLKIR